MFYSFRVPSQHNKLFRAGQLATNEDKWTREHGSIQKKIDKQIKHHVVKASLECPPSQHNLTENRKFSSGGKLRQKREGNPTRPPTDDRRA